MKENFCKVLLKNNILKNLMAYVVHVIDTSPCMIGNGNVHIACVWQSLLQLIGNNHIGNICWLGRDNLPYRMKYCGELNLADARENQQNEFYQCESCYHYLSFHSISIRQIKVCQTWKKTNIMNPPNITPANISYYTVSGFLRTKSNLTLAWIYILYQGQECSKSN